MTVVKGYEYPVTTNRKCTGCQRNFGPDSEFKTGFLVRDGEVTGLFHSRACYEQTVQKFTAYKAEHPKEE